MRTVVMHVDGSGVIWALARCRECGEVHKYLAADAIAHRVSCKSCRRPMEIQGAVIAAAEADPKFREKACGVTGQGTFNNADQ